VHEIPESLLDVEGTALEEERLAVILDFSCFECVRYSNLCDFIGIEAEEFIGFGVERDTIKEVFFHSAFDIFLDFLQIAHFNEYTQYFALPIHDEFAVILLLQIQQVGQSDIREDDILLIVGERDGVSLQTLLELLLEEVDCCLHP
jgi:hypothetical protein